MKFEAYVRVMQCWCEDFILTGINCKYCLPIENREISAIHVNHEYNSTFHKISV